MTSTEHNLYGCSPEPLSSYLKSLGLFKVIGEQFDLSASACFTESGFILDTKLSEEELFEKLTKHYVPTSILSPWNGRVLTALQNPESSTKKIEKSESTRLDNYRKTIEISKKVLDVGKQNNWLSHDEKKSNSPYKTVKKSKIKYLNLCRSLLPDDTIEWMDASLIIFGDNISYPKFLGTGGNIGSLDLSLNFIEHVLILVDEVDKNCNYEKSELWLKDTIYALNESQAVKKSASQFNPGASGGANSSVFGKAEGLVNPWEFVLSMEGILLFGGSPARRLSFSSQGVGSAPFSAVASIGGYETPTSSKGPEEELWAPIWCTKSSLVEIKRFFSEGRVDIKGSHAKTGLDFAFAASSLGIDRGISAFSRYIFSPRDGQSSFAVTAGRIEVKKRPEVTPLVQLAKWVNRVYISPECPNSVTLHKREFEKLAFGISSGDKNMTLVQCLIAASELENAIAKSSQYRSNQKINPISGLTADMWIPQILLEEDLSWNNLELKLAIALSSVSSKFSKDSPLLSIRTLVSSVEMKNGIVDFREAGPVISGFGSRDIYEVLAELHYIKGLMLQKESKSGNSLEKNNTNWVWSYGINIASDEFFRFVYRKIDELAFERYLSALMLLDWRGFKQNIISHHSNNSDQHGITLPFESAISCVTPFFATQKRTRKLTTNNGDNLKPDKYDDIDLAPKLNWIRLLGTNHVSEVLHEAWLSLKIAGLNPISINRSKYKIRPLVDGPALAAGLLFKQSSYERNFYLDLSCDYLGDAGNSSDEKEKI